MIIYTISRAFCGTYSPDGEYFVKDDKYKMEKLEDGSFCLQLPKVQLCGNPNTEEVFLYQSGRRTLLGDIRIEAVPTCIDFDCLYDNDDESEGELL